MILYLHGFRSAPASRKARLLAAHMQALGLGERFACPQLPPSPRAAITLAESLMADAGEPITLVGSSLGGYYASCLSERHGCKAVLVNPAVAPYRSLAGFVGRHSNLFTGELFDFTETDVAALRALDVAQPSRPELLWLMVETGDEVLDYRAAVARYVGARQLVIEGGDHSFRSWPAMLDEVLRFAGMLPAH